MRRILFGMVLGWLAARWYYFGGQLPTAEAPGMEARDLRERGRSMADEAARAARDLGEEAKVAARMGRASLEEKAERIRDAAGD